jgi:signal transduction histidine kinase
VTDPANQSVWEISVSPAKGAAEGNDRIVVVTRDITAMVALESAARQASIMSALGSVAGGVAHEVRNPLFGITANLDAMEMEFGQSVEGFRDYVRLLRKDVGRLTSLMNDLLQYGKPHALDLCVCAAEEIVAQAVQLCRNTAVKADVSIEIALSARPHFYADASRIVEVLRNLVENAIAFSPPGGTVTIEVALSDREHALLCVSDHGPGFREEDLPHVFEPFFSRRRGGTGLGLAICQRTVVEHRGSICAGNRAGRGAKVEIRLPLGARESV